MATNEVAANEPILSAKENNITIGSDPPSAPIEGTLWIDTTTSGQPVAKVYTGSDWLEAGGGGGIEFYTFWGMG